jgi:hypothetical protein
MLNIIKNYLKELGVEYVPGMKVRWRTRHGNSSSDHVCILSQKPLPPKLNIHDYPQLEHRVINNVLYVNSVDEDDYNGKRGFYFSEDHYTVIEKINYALSLLVYDKNPYGDSIYNVRYFKFHSKKELEESKRLLIKYYIESTKPLRLLLIKHFDLDDVVFSFDRIIDTLLSINTTDPDEIYVTLVHAGLISPDDSGDCYSDLKNHIIDTDYFIFMESTSGSNSDNISENILETEETLADFVLNTYSEVYPVSDGSHGIVYNSLIEHGVVLPEVADEKITLSCEMVIKDYQYKSEIDPKIIRAEISMETSIFLDLLDDIQDVTRAVDSDAVETRDLDTGLLLLKYRLDVDNWTNCPVNTFDYELGCPVIETRYSNLNKKQNSGYYGGTVTFDGKTVTFGSSVKTDSMTTSNGKYILINRMSAVSDNEQERLNLIKEMISTIEHDYIHYALRNIDKIDVNNISLTDGEISTAIQNILENNLSSIGSTLSRITELRNAIDITNPSYFEKIEVMGISYYWIKFTNLLPILSKYKDELDKDEATTYSVLECCRKIMGDNWVDHLVYSIPVSIKYNN